MTGGTATATGAGPTWFQRFLLPGFAFKAVVIGGGYATGRELAEFFLPSGPWGGLAAMLLAMILWSIICAATFALARALGAFDYRSFFERLLGPGWVLFEVAYVLFVTLVLAVFGAAAGEIGAAIFGWPPLAGTALLAGSIALFVTFGNASVEGLFKYVSFLLYGVYALFMVLALGSFGDEIAARFAIPVPTDGWIVGGLTYTGYNVIGAVVILPVIRHLTSQRDAVVSGLIAGPLAMAPAILFFVAMIAFYPGIIDETLPSDFMLQQLKMPLFHLLFQFMIFAALLESGAGSVHAINERVDAARRARGRAPLGRRARGGIAGALLVGCMFLADRFGLVTLIASGYRTLSWVFLAVYVVPVLTIGMARLARATRGAKDATAIEGSAQ
ncbi:YkvI family membrane protein [Sphingopyxis sp.]|uniref:YkvI family membrane protein n=1 Tax=Sphingopyxis sp. TaxID=1908224 RepID=UPI003D0D4234